MSHFNLKSDCDCCLCPDLKPTQTPVPSMRIRIAAGKVWIGNTLKTFTAQLSPLFTQPNTGSQVGVVGLNSAGQLVNLVGAVSINPVMPTIPPTGFFPIAAVLLQAVQTTIVDDAIADLRCFHRFGVAAFPHNYVTDRNAADCHPIAAITGLQPALDAKQDVTPGLVTLVDVQTEIADTIDTLNGLDTKIFRLNQQEAGPIPTELVALELTGGPGDPTTITGGPSILYDPLNGRVQINDGDGNGPYQIPKQTTMDAILNYINSTDATMQFLPDTYTATINVVKNVTVKITNAVGVTNTFRTGPTVNVVKLAGPGTVQTPVITFANGVATAQVLSSGAGAMILGLNTPSIAGLDVSSQAQITWS